MTRDADITHEIGRKGMAARYGIPLGAFGCAFLLLVVTMSRPVTPYDEGLILVGSTRVLSGDILYRDFYANYGPAQFYILAGLFKLFGPSVLVERLWDTLIRSCTVLVIYLIVDHAWSTGRAIFLAALTVVWLSYFENY
jgi:4-amino-4-deoxy-L-arabinose transferase-like glycosyltransferase